MFVMSGLLATTTRASGGWSAASCRVPVLVTGVTSQKPSLTRVVAAGSVVSCDSVLSGAAARGVLQLSQPQSPQSAAPGSSKPESCSTHVTARFSP
jgi:primosomal replication protein N